MSTDGSKVAVLLINLASTPADLSVSFSEIPGFKGTTAVVRDIWARKDVGSFTSSYTAANVASHDAAFLMITVSKSADYAAEM